MKSLLLHMVLHKPCTTNSKWQKCNYFGSVIMFADLSRYSADLCHAPLWSFVVLSGPLRYLVKPGLKACGLQTTEENDDDDDECLRHRLVFCMCPAVS